MPHFSLLPVIVGLPFLGALCLFCIKGDERVVATNSKNVALWVSGVVFALSVFVFLKFDFAVDVLQFKYENKGIPSLLLNWRMGLNALSVPFLMLTALFSFAAVLITQKNLPMVKIFLMMILMIEGFLLGAVCSRNLFQFFLFHEGAFIPLFMLSAVWNEKKDDRFSFRQYFYFFLSTVLFFFGLLYLYTQTGSLNLDALARKPFSPFVQTVLLAVFLPAFMINVPLVPFHAWFLKAQANTPPACVLILSGAMSKLALYGTLAIIVALCPDVMREYARGLMWWATASAVFAAVSLFFKPDIKEKVVYAQMSLFGVATAAIFSMTPTGIAAVLAFCLTQSFVLVAFVFVLSFLFERVQGSDLSRLSGLISEIPVFGAAFFGAVCCFVVLPATPAFTAAFSMMNRIFQTDAAAGVCALTAMMCIFAAVVGVYSKIMLGNEQKTFFPYADLRWKEKIMFGVFVVVLGYFSLSPAVLSPPCQAGTRVAVSSDLRD